MAFTSAVKMSGPKVEFPALYIRPGTKDFYLNVPAMALVASNNGSKTPRCVLVWWDPDTKSVGLSFHSDEKLRARNNYKLVHQHAGTGPIKSSQFCCRWLQDRIDEAKVITGEGRYEFLLEECTEPGCEPEYVVRLGGELEAPLAHNE